MKIDEIKINKKTLLIYWNVIISDIEQKEIPEEDFDFFDLKYIKSMEIIKK